METDRDPTVRREMARLLRKFARGGLTVNEFEREAKLLSEKDPTPAALDAYLFAWHFYCDFGTERLTGEWRLPPESRRLWARWVLFLMASDEEYQGPPVAPSLVPASFIFGYLVICGAMVSHYPAIAAAMFVACVLGAPNWILEWVSRLVGSNQDPLPDYWPFATKEAFDRATRLANPFAPRTQEA